MRPRAAALTWADSRGKILWRELRQVSSTASREPRSAGAGLPPPARLRHGLWFYVDLLHPLGVDLVVPARLTEPAGILQGVDQVQAHILVVGVLLEEPQAVPDDLVDLAGRVQRRDPGAEEGHVYGADLLGERNGPVLVGVVLQEATGVSGEGGREQLGGVQLAAPVCLERDVGPLQEFLDVDRDTGA